MNRQKDESYPLEHPELIPDDEEQAGRRLEALMTTDPPASADRPTFLRGWWALFWLNPGLHPDDWEVWEADFESFKPLAVEAFLRATRRDLEDDELYPAEAAHMRLKRGQELGAE